jgi:hypothetical protein
MTTEENTQKDNLDQIEDLKKTIASAEKTIQDARSALMQLGESSEEPGDGNIVFGEFDGQVMISDDGKQYPIPANYASKSKLIEGDKLKLNITPDGSFIYKQIGPAERKTIIGSVNQDESGNFYVVAEGKPYKVLLASITYFKVEPGDEVVIVTSKNTDSSWAAIENVLRKSEGQMPVSAITSPDEATTQTTDKSIGNQSLTDEWASDIEEIKQQIKEEKMNKE